MGLKGNQQVKGMAPNTHKVEPFPYRKCYWIALQDSLLWLSNQITPQNNQGLADSNKNHGIYSRVVFMLYLQGHSAETIQMHLMQPLFKCGHWERGFTCATHTMALMHICSVQHKIKSRSLVSQWHQWLPFHFQITHNSSNTHSATCMQACSNAVAANTQVLTTYMQQQQQHTAVLSLS